MLEVDFDLRNGGWQPPVIKPNAGFKLDPSNATLHYAIECFEGSKAYRTVDDKVIMFRADENFKRMNQSHLQLGIPTFDRFQMLECCRRLVEVEKDWIPNKPLHSLYLRPTSICMDNRLGLSRVTKAKTFIIMSPVGPYYPRGFVPVKLFCDTNVIRAWPKGFGDKKVGGNYAPTLKTQRDGLEKHGCDQVLWLLHDYVLEVGTMNFFVFWKNEDGEDELITPPLDGTILPGITRMSLIELMKELKEFKVSVRKFKVQEMIKATEEGRMYEAFGAGTAAIVCPV
jgi:branched-chain amino acid aminotransferase|mmetsp:Transcript_3470/g.4597  ORF Transcript_3470/g.4597 Transcript_3470/m.4597 type:complete len:284 (+) Transcript_3470:304-1155(+)